MYLCLVAKLGNERAIGDVIKLVLFCRVINALFEVVSRLDVHGSILLLALGQREAREEEEESENEREREMGVCFHH